MTMLGWSSGSVADAMGFRCIGLQRNSLRGLNGQRDLLFGFNAHVVSVALPQACSLLVLPWYQAEHRK